MSDQLLKMSDQQTKKFKKKSLELVALCSFSQIAGRGL